MSSYKFDLISPGEAKAFWDTSPHASVFTNPEVLHKLSQRVDWWLAWKGNEPACLWPVCMPDNKSVELPLFTYYVGPMWSQIAYDIPVSRWLASSMQVYGGFIKLFIEKYNRIKTCLPVGLTDVRVFDWWNYGESDKPRFAIQPRYTPRIESLQDVDDEQIIVAFRRNDKCYALRRIMKTGPPPFTDEWDVHDFIRLYDQTMKRQGLATNERITNQIRSLVDLVHSGFGEVIACKDPDTGEVISLRLLLYGKGVANGVINLVADSWQQRDLPVWIAYNSIKISRERGMHCFDFNGANSPNRGDEKHSYGAAPVLYFQCQYPGK